MRRSFKVATVFTGAAALAGGYGPAALAATTQATAVHPDVTFQECGANDDGVSNWVHLYYPADDHPAECIGGATSNHAVSATIASFCPGNNNGWFDASVDGNPLSSPIYFYAGSGRHSTAWWTGGYPEVHVYKITIKNWAGEAKCT
jgi:hypothetical protein